VKRQPTTDAVTISDCEGRGHIKIEWAGDDEWKLSLQFDTVSATLTTPYLYSEKSLPDFFADLAANWKGWKGERVWSAYALGITAVHNGRSRVLLTLDIHPFAVPNPWRATATLEVEPGELEGIVADLRDFTNPTEAA
jgi:hypothetical protein